MKSKKTLTALALLLSVVGLASCSESAVSSSAEQSSDSVVETTSSSEDISAESTAEDEGSSDNGDEEENSGTTDIPDVLDLSDFDSFLEYYNETVLNLTVSNASYTEATSASTYTTSKSVTYTAAADETLYDITENNDGASSAHKEYMALVQDEDWGELYYEIADYSINGTDYGYKRQLVDTQDEITDSISQGLKSRYEAAVADSFFTLESVAGDSTVPFSAFSDSSYEFVCTAYAINEQSDGSYAVSIAGYHETASSSDWGKCYTETVGILLDEDYIPTYGTYTAQYASNASWDYNNHIPSSSSSTVYSGTFSNLTYVDELEAGEEPLLDYESYFITEITDAYLYTSSSTAHNEGAIEDGIYHRINSYNPTDAIDASTYSITGSSDPTIVSVSYGYGIAQALGQCTLYIGNFFHPQLFSVEFNVNKEAATNACLYGIVNDSNYTANENYTNALANEQIIGTLSIPYSSSSNYTTTVRLFGYKKPANSDTYNIVNEGPWNLPSIYYNDDADIESETRTTWSSYAYATIAEDNDTTDAYAELTIRMYGTGTTYLMFSVSSEAYYSGNVLSSYIYLALVIS